MTDVDTPSSGGIKGVFTRKIGPLPAIAWGGILGGVYVLFRYYKNATSPEPVAVNTPLGAVGDIGSADDFSDGYGNATGDFGGSIIPGSTTSTSYQEPAVQTNQDWGKRAANYLISIGINPLDAQQAINSYLYTSGDLNSTQSAALAQALFHFGTPPEGVIAPPATIPNTTPQQQYTPPPDPPYSKPSDYPVNTTVATMPSDRPA